MRAVPLFEATLAQRVRVLGDTHPDTLRSRNNLADAYRDAGDPTRAPLNESDEPDAHPSAGATPIGHETPVPPIPQ
ncbi:tetratricopeptide repeat protein [Streptomyces laculatispora]|uniref:tetratricopeptide repeat protein n=1 Tax=Streptomyces laculatispora TaxID=887464 RepID=UPI0027DE1443|nr:tetratricopeptide repeat protein [Streptomyces laculatispora]